MSETKMLAIAFCSTMAMSLIAAGALFFMGAGPLAVVIGGTLAGVATYVAVCLLCLPHVPKPAVELFEEGEDYV